MNILALDVATKTGWATATSSGVWDFKTKSDEHKDVRLIRFRNKLKETILFYEIDLVVFERCGGQHKTDIKVSSEFIGNLKSLCDEMNIMYTAYSASEIKKFATGKGNANKALMVSKAKEVFPHINIIDDNHADALFIYNLACMDFGNHV